MEIYSLRSTFALCLAGNMCKWDIGMLFDVWLIQVRFCILMALYVWINLHPFIEGLSESTKNHLNSGKLYLPFEVCQQVGKKMGCVSKQRVKVFECEGMWLSQGHP